MSKHLKNNSSDCNSTPSKICSGFFLPGACCFFVILFNISISWVPVQTLIMHESIDADFSGWKSLSTFSIQCGFVVCSELKANVSHCISHRPYSTNFKVVEKEKKLSAQVTLTSLVFLCFLPREPFQNLHSRRLDWDATCRHRCELRL